MSARHIEIDLHEVDFPTEARGSVHAVTGYDPSKPDHYTILVDGSQNEAQQLASFLHECTHIYLGHFQQQGRSASELEAEVRVLLSSATASLETDFYPTGKELCQ